jgi:hypothetical protein
MAVTKNILPVREYQVWTSANMTAGDILGVSESLGGRVADTVTLESSSGDSTVRFNVVKQIYRNHGSTWSGVADSAGRTYADSTVHNAWTVAGVLRSSPVLVSEFEDTAMQNDVIQNGTSQTWTAAELGVKDIKLVTPSGLRITVT